MNTKTTTIRIPTEKLQKIDELCKKTHNCRNSWINAAIDLVFDYGSEYDFGFSEDDEPEESKPAPMAQWELIDDDGNVIASSKQDNSDLKPTVTILD